MNKLMTVLAAAALASPILGAQGLEITASELADKMAPGWNLGNTFEACNSAHLYTNNGGLASETSWQRTKTTSQLIDFIKEQGFRSIRIPVAWVCGHVTDTDEYTIDPAWMSRVKEVIDYCVARDIYVVLNDHWDGGWLENHIADNSVKTKNKEILRKIWTQIAEKFRNYDEHLLFAGLNEPNADNASATANLLEYEQVFVDAVRATGGNNLGRVLVVQGPNTDISKTEQYYNTLPVDPTPDRLIVEVHYYTPWQFCGMDKDESWGRYVNYWGEGNCPAGSSRYYANGEAEMDRLFGLMKTKFTDRGIPVIIGEYSCNQKTVRGTGESQELHDASVTAFYTRLNTLCRDYKMVSYAWDTNNPYNPTSTIIDRSKLTIYNQRMMDAIKGVYAEYNGIGEIDTDDSAEDAPAVYYNLQGVRVTDPTPGLYIVVRGNRTSKEVVR